MKQPQRTIRGRDVLAAELAQTMPEKQWLARLIGIAKDEGWEVNHVFEQRAYARRTVKGWPDLECLRERLLFIEAKNETGKISEDQARIIELLRDAGQEIYVLRPSQEEEARRILQRLPL